MATTRIEIIFFGLSLFRLKALEARSQLGPDQYKCFHLTMVFRSSGCLQYDLCIWKQTDHIYLLAFEYLDKEPYYVKDVKLTNSIF